MVKSVNLSKIRQISGASSSPSRWAPHRRRGPSTSDVAMAEWVTFASEGGVATWASGTEKNHDLLPPSMAREERAQARGEGFGERVRPHDRTYPCHGEFSQSAWFTGLTTRARPRPSRGTPLPPLSRGECGKGPSHVGARWALVGTECAGRRLYHGSSWCHCHLGQVGALSQCGFLYGS